MADDKPKVPTEETPSVEDQIKDIQDKELSRELGTEVKDGKVVEDQKPKEEEKPKEESKPKEEQKEDKPKETSAEKEQRERDEKGRFKPQNIDTEKLKEEVSQATADKITKALSGKEDDETKEVSVYRKMAQDFMTSQQALGKNPSWEDAFEFLAENTTKLAIDGIKQAEEAKIAEQKLIQETQAKSNEERAKAFNKFTDDQLEDLYSAGKLPKIENATDETDPGVVARKALFTKMMEVNQDRVAKGKQPIYSIKEIYYEHYTPPTQQPAGADAPISAGRGGVNGQDNKELDYQRDVKGPKSFLDIMMDK